jgi:beta-glucosidase/6-phospho-beta-glucosidase/beta-galactosidase
VYFSGNAEVLATRFSDRVTTCMTVNELWNLNEGEPMASDDALTAA